MQVLNDEVKGEFNNVMLDLETYGTSVGCAIMSIGAVAFANGRRGATFHEIVNRESNAKYGLMEEQGTIDWWNKQSDDAKKTLTLSTNGGISIVEALERFNDFLKSCCPSGRVRVWGNGSDFDNAILIHAFAKCSVPAGWKFYNNRCYRTLKALVPYQPLTRRTGVHHNALDDAISQADHAIELLDELGVSVRDI